MAENNTIGRRISYIAMTAEMGITEFAESINMDGSQLGKVIAGKMNITLKQVLEITSKYGIRAGWLIEGEGPMTKEKSGTFEVPDHLLTAVREEAEKMRLSLERIMKAASTNLDLNTSRVPGSKPVDLGLGKKAGSQKTDKQKDTAHEKGK